MMSPIMHLGIALIVLMIDSALEMAFICSIVGYLHRSGANQYPFVTEDNTVIYVNAKPKNLLTNQGHASNGAAGTALVLICFGGFLVLWYQRRRERMNSALHPSKIFLAYTVFTILSFLLTVAALAYTFIVGHQTSGQSIDPSIAAQVQSHAYPEHDWAPGTWTKALLDLPLQNSKDRDYLNGWLRVMNGYEYNLIPLMIIGLVIAALSVRVALVQRRQARGRVGEEGFKG